MVQSLPSSPKNHSSSTSSQTREQSVESFRQFLRQADKLIKEEQFAQAKEQVAEAKKIDPTNPFIKVFEERIALFETRISIDADSVAHVSLEKGEGAHAIQEVKHLQEETVPPERELLEHKLRQKLETEYKERFTREVRKAEEHVAKILHEERAKLEVQRQVLKDKYEKVVTAANERFESEYRKKLEEETHNAECRLQEQFQAKLAVMEQEIRGQLATAFESEQRQLQEGLQRRHEELLTKERHSFEEREKILKEQFDRQLLDALRKAESAIREQSLQEQRFALEQLRKQLMDEFHASLEKEREANELQYEAMRENVEASFVAEQQKLKQESERQLEEQLQRIRQRESQGLEDQRAALLQELRTSLQSEYQQKLENEERRIRADAEKTVEEEKKRIQSEYDALLVQQDDLIRRTRSDLQKEMEDRFLRRLEQISHEYDHKMELLGTTVPQMPEEKRALYRERMRKYYIDGMSTVEEAKRIMELKELLGLSFDEHLAMEADIRLDLYVEQVEQKIIEGKLNLRSTDVMDELKRQFRITPEESARLEPYILSSLERLAVKGRILLVDDDLLLLKAIDDLLNESGYQVVPASSVKDALEYVQTASVDIIVSDIKFGENDLDGFQFFTSVQSQPHLRKVPFIFMSALRDGVIIRSGIQLGADDYLTKPIDPDLLLAVIEGKLKRFRRFDRN